MAPCLKVRKSGVWRDSTSVIVAGAVTVSTPDLSGMYEFLGAGITVPVGDFCCVAERFQAYELS